MSLFNLRHPVLCVLLCVHEIDRNSAVELAQLSETILPPPELFDTDRCCSSLGNDQSMFLLPPPAEFDSVSRASSTADLPLPPPPAFFDVDNEWPPTAANYDDLAASCQQCSKSVETSQVTQPNASETASVNVYNGVDGSDGDDDQFTETAEEVIGSGDYARSWNGVEQSSNTETRVTSNGDEALLVPVSTASGVGNSQQARVAKDVMHKLDELCRSQGPLHVTPPSSSAVVIPVYHETTSGAAGAGRLQHQRSMGQSWSDGLFVWDADAGNGLSDKCSKRHSAGASLSDMVVSSNGALGARPKVSLLKSRSAFEGLDWKRRPGVLRAQSAGVVGPHHQLAARRLLCHYTPEGREFSVHTETRRVEVKEELRHRSLEPDEIQSSTTSTDDSRLASVLSDSYLPSTSIELSSKDGKTRRFFSQQTLSTTSSTGHKNLLEQASERRKASRMMPKFALTSVFGASPSITAGSETSHAAQRCDNDVQRSVSDVAARTAGSGPVRVSGEPSDEPATSRRMPMTSAERSMETMKVSRPSSLVVRTSTSEAGSPVRVLVAQSPSQSEDDVQSAAAENEPHPLLARHAPLCSPETSSFDTASEAASGRASPDTTSVSTFQGNFSEMAISVGDDTTAADTSTTSTTAAERHFIVVAIDFGTTYSGYAFSFVRDPDSVHMMRRWEGGDPGVVNQKTPTTLLLDPAGKFHSFGYAARDSYHDLDTQEAKKWLYFDKFKMVLHHNAVSTEHRLTLYVQLCVNMCLVHASVVMQ